jgi:hypothetical protein
LSEINVYVNVTHHMSHDCYSQGNYEKAWVRINVNVNVTHHITVILKVNMKNLEWDKCLCKCYTSYDCYSQSKYEKSWVR